MATGERESGEEEKNYDQRKLDIFLSTFHITNSKRNCIFFFWFMFDLKSESTSKSNLYLWKICGDSCFYFTFFIDSSYMDGHQHHLHQLQYLNKHHHHHLHPQSQTPEIASAAAGDRFPQWSIEETMELIAIRGELDQTFMETKRNKLLWEVISNKMRDKSFLRSPEQCKCKWKNLVTRFKGCETMEAETARQLFPFYDDMQIIFTGRMQRMLWAESEGGGGGTSGTTRKRSHLEQFSSDEEEENVNEELQVDISINDPKIQNPKKNIVKKRKGGSSSTSGNNSVREVLEEFMRHQMRMEKEWRERWEAREKERTEKEKEWRKKMEELEKERVAMERMWRDREEERRSREEMRAEKRDSLINALLAKLTRDGSL